MEGKYNCKYCKVEWIFFHDDYGSREYYPDICPLCSMPITQMIHDVYVEEGLLAVLKMLWVRIKTKFKK